ncbi:MAG TPA: helix-turn-helix transcriptional regulator [Trebonia sp.]|jgi:transcriptional regulator with XRE-family HTH domain
MAVNNGGNPATHFGRQMRKERLARGWSLREFAARTGINIGHASRIENGKRPPTENAAAACDLAFPERKGWFTEYYQELRGWSEVPAAFKDWQELEDKAASLRVWMPGIVHGLLQTEDYARALIAAVPRTSPEAATGRLASRMDRQQRVLMRQDDPATVWFVVDELALYRCVGSGGVMAVQMRRLCDVAAMPLVTLQVLPAVAHCANASEFIIAGDSAAYAEHVTGGYVFTDEQTVSALAVRFDTLRGECYKVSESAALLERMCELWSAGVSPLTLTATAGPA